MDKFHENISKYNLTHWFQPIFNLKNDNIISYEALLRDASKNNNSPAFIFNEADKGGYRNILDKMSIIKAIDIFKNESCTLFLNIFPSTLLETNFLSWWNNNVPPHMNVILELLESDPIISWKELKNITKELHKKNVKIAIDDLGEGYSFFQQWIELDPDYIKIDRYYASDLSVNLKKQKTLKSIVDLFADTTKLVIEGIETEKDLKTAKILGISYAQGYLLGKPSPMESLIANY